MLPYKNVTKFVVPRGSKRNFPDCGYYQNYLVNFSQVVAFLKNLVFKPHSNLPIYRFTIFCILVL